MTFINICMAWWHGRDRISEPLGIWGFPSSRFVSLHVPGCSFVLNGGCRPFEKVQLCGSPVHAYSGYHFVATLHDVHHQQLQCCFISDADSFCNIVCFKLEHTLWVQPSFHQFTCGRCP